MTATRPSVTGAYVGASGFSYPTWRRGFYPPGTREKDFLRFYSERLPSVELNTTFYSLPSEGQLQRWAEQTPPDFRFAVKMTGWITHRGGLSRLGTFCESMHALGDKLGPVLIQFPETRPRDDGMLHLLLGSLDPDLTYAFDLRHESWDVDDQLFDFGAARVGSSEGSAPFRYFRMRDPPYGRRRLDRTAEEIARLLSNRIEVHCYFKHEDEPTGPRYAEQVLRRLAQKRAAVSRASG